MTTQDMIDQAMEEGASIYNLGFDNFVKVTDEGNWCHADRGVEVSVTREEALALMDAHKGIFA